MWLRLVLGVFCCWLMQACADDDAARFRPEAQESKTARSVDAAAAAPESESAGAPPARSADAGVARKLTTQPTAAPPARPMPRQEPVQPPTAARPRTEPGGLDAGVEEDAGPGPFGPFPTHVDCTGKRGAPGNTTRMYNDRSYIVHIPTAANPNTALPVMFVFHGAGGTGAQMQAATGFDILADQVGIVTVYPDGQAGNAPWNVGAGVCPPGNFVSTTRDDEAYVERMLADVEQDQCVDKDRVFATGFSMGAYFSNELGCKLGKTTFRAIAPHSGGTHAGSCPGAPLPVLLLHGDKDSLINYSCGTRARDYWIERNGCSEESDRLDVQGGHCDFQRGCPKEAPVVLCSFDGMDHTWAFPPTYENAGILIWLFFSQFM